MYRFDELGSFQLERVRAAAGVELGTDELARTLDARPDLRLRVPSVLGVRELDDLIGADIRARSTADLDAAARLARVFVPTRAYARTLDVLQAHRFAVLAGPPEMGKTAIARMLSLALATGGWEAHECIRPEELWRTYARDRRQVFVADDAFGSTEYRPDAAERWAVELDRVLRAMDERHLLVWTSRPAPLRVALRRIHREHGVERWPQPGEVQVAADALDVEEKALILFRHARAATLESGAKGLVRAYGYSIVSHPHFTPERIRRFVGERLAELPEHGVAAAVDEAIREPTRAMAASLLALGPEHRTLLVALVDTPPGPVPERELAAAARRHAEAGLGRPPGELVDRLTDHFVRVVPPASVTWVHPSWRDLVIEELAADPSARRRFVERASLDGLLLAVSVTGGAAGERCFPLLVADADWDAAADRVAALVPELDDAALYRLLTALAEAHGAAPADRRAEVDSTAHTALELARRAWDRSRAPVPVTLLDAWLALAALVEGAPPPPELGPTWVELAPAGRVDVTDVAELAQVDDWAALVASLRERAPDLLARFVLPSAAIDALAEDAYLAPPEARELVGRALYRLGVRALPRLAEPVDAPGLAPEPPRERRRREPERELVARILRDL